VNTDLDAAEVSRFRALLADRLGWTFVDTDAPQLARVLHDRADRHALSHGGYLRRLGEAGWRPELAALVEELTITETYFFRHAEQFHALTEVALPQRIRARAGEKTLRLLSVGCSSGEEAYSLAIVALEAVGDPPWTISVLGLDANPDMLRRAGVARYSSWSLRETPDPVRRRWFRPLEGGFELDRRVHDRVRFREYNVADEDPVLWHREQYDVIFCRNLLMYLTPTTAQLLIRRMTRALAPGGYLFLGHTDTLGSRPDGLESLHTNGTFYYRRPDPDEPSTRPRDEPSTRPRDEPATRKRDEPAARPRDTAAGVPGDVAGRTRAAGARPAGVGTGPPTAAGQPHRPRRATEAAFRDQALALLLAERFGEALGVVEAGLPPRPDPRDLLLHGVLLAQTGCLDDAEMVCRRLLDVDGPYADAHHLLGVCLDGGAAVEVAIGHYRLAAHLDPDFAMPRLRLGLLARRRGDHPTGGAELDRAVILLPQERAERIALFGGGFGRLALLALCRAEIDACGTPR
jgi:chemotaxis protein methyltransferase CheR